MKKLAFFTKHASLCKKYNIRFPNCRLFSGRMFAKKPKNIDSRFMPKRRRWRSSWLRSSRSSCRMLASSRTRCATFQLSQPLAETKWLYFFILSNIFFRPIIYHINYTNNANYVIIHNSISIFYLKTVHPGRDSNRGLLFPGRMRWPLRHAARSFIYSWSLPVHWCEQGIFEYCLFSYFSSTSWP
jgi:hypothetical protein